MTTEQAKEYSYRAVVDLYYCENCGVVFRIVDGFTRNPDEPAVFYTGAVLRWCYACHDYHKFIKLGG